MSKTRAMLAAGCVAGLTWCGGCEPPPAQQAPPVPTAPGIVSTKSGSQPGPVDADAPEEFTTTESGLKYRIRRKSDGKKPTVDDQVKVNYRGWLDNNEVFDTTYGSEPAVFSVQGVVPGFREGLQLIGEGGMIELEIPGPLGYPNGSGPIPPGATLHFLVELIAVQ